VTPLYREETCKIAVKDSQVQNLNFWVWREKFFKTNMEQEEPFVIVRLQDITLHSKKSKKKFPIAFFAGHHWFAVRLSMHNK
jgi:hypothetical protein